MPLKAGCDVGPQSVRMAWGTAQEGATLWALMHALPKSKLLEAGLFCVDQSQFPRAWGFKKGELPRMGASPDGLLFHPNGLCQVSPPAAAPVDLYLLPSRLHSQTLGCVLKQCSLQPQY